jgi:NAD+ synthase
MFYEDLEKTILNIKDKNYEKYLKIRKRNLHKINQIQICKFNNNE